MDFSKKKWIVVLVQNWGDALNQELIRVVIRVIVAINYLRPLR
jgi:hypothetical protein